MTHYIPHSPVVKKNTSKTKVRVVFDTSLKCTNELSLNDCLIPGPNLNPSVLNLTLCFTPGPILARVAFKVGPRMLLIK